jgi:hypothetical protein
VVRVPFSPTTATRCWTYAGLACVFFTTAVTMAAAKAKHLSEPFNLVVSDGRFYYAYLPSIVLDGDVDFTNQVREHWGTDYSPEILTKRTPTGLIRNFYPIGLALTLLPAFIVGHITALASGGVIPANGYSWPYQLACLALIELLVWRTLVRIDWLATERCGARPGPTFLAILLLALGTPYAYYAFREPFMVHVVSAFWCTEVIALAASATQLHPLRFWPALAFCGAMAAICRPTNAFLVPTVLFAALQSLRTANVRTSLMSLPTAVVAALPLGLQFLVWRHLFGSWVYYSYEEVGFHWTHPALWQTLLSSRHGLFFWAPILLLGLAGLMLRIRDGLVQCGLLGAGLLWYANSAWENWWFGDAFGARAFLELSGLFGVGLALALSRLETRPRLAKTIVLATIAFNFIFMILYITHRIPRGDYLLP